MGENLLPLHCCRVTKICYPTWLPVWGHFGQRKELALQSWRVSAASSTRNRSYIKLKHGGGIKERIAISMKGIRLDHHNCCLHSQLQWGCTDICVISLLSSTSAYSVLIWGCYSNTKTTSYRAWTCSAGLPGLHALQKLGNFTEEIQCKVLRDVETLNKDVNSTTT